jgi:hypothetical protein
MPYTRPSLSVTGWKAVPVWWFLVAFLSGFGVAMWAEDLILSWHDDQLLFAAPKLHFLSGKPLERLRNAAPVPFDFQITLWSGSRDHIFGRKAERFVVSYDLWEERYSVTKMTAPRKTNAHLTAVAAEQWCLQQMPLEVAGLDRREPFWTRLEVRAAEDKSSKDGPLFGRGSLSESGISLNGLVEIFSRPAQTGQPHWVLEAGPMTLDEVRRSRGG